MSAAEQLERDYEAVAEALVAEALEGYEKYLTPAALDEIREGLLTELLCTNYGRLRLASCLEPTGAETMESSDVAIIGPAPSAAKRAKSEKAT